jgi:hypothetical protein
VEKCERFKARLSPFKLRSYVVAIVFMTGVTEVGGSQRRDFLAGKVIAQAPQTILAIHSLVDAIPDLDFLGVYQ